MANHKSALKRDRQTKKIALCNKSTKSSIYTAEKRLIHALSGKDKEAALNELKKFSSAIDKAAQKGVVHVKRAARKVARLSKRLHSAFEN